GYAIPPSRRRQPLRCSATCPAVPVDPPVCLSVAMYSGRWRASHGRGPVCFDGRLAFLTRALEPLLHHRFADGCQFLCELGAWILHGHSVCPQLFLVPVGKLLRLRPATFLGSRSGLGDRLLVGLVQAVPYVEVDEHDILRK